MKNVSFAKIDDHVERRGDFERLNSERSERDVDRWVELVFRSDDSVFFRAALFHPNVCRAAAGKDEKQVAHELGFLNKKLNLKLAGNMTKLLCA